MNRIIIKNPSNDEENILFLNSEQENNETYFIDNNTGVQLEIVSKQHIGEWFAENYKTFGINLQFVSNRTQEGNQFCKGFGGIGGLLRWKIEFNEIKEFNYSDDDDFFV